MRLSSLHVALFVVPLFLAGCGDGWEAQRTTDIVPYGNTRTAGSGVVYVRAKMLPEKEIVVEQSEPEIKPADEVFTRAQTKGAVVPPPAAKVDAPVKEEAAKEEKKTEVKEAQKEEPAKAEETKAPEPNNQIAPASGIEKSAPAIEQKKTYEQIIDEKQGSISPADVEPHAGTQGIERSTSSTYHSPDGKASLEIVTVPEEVNIESKSNKSVMPVNEISSPMMDVYNREYEAEKSLEEIYSTPF